MTTQTDDDEEKIRHRYREIRDNLKTDSVKVDMASRASRNIPSISALFSHQKAIYEWLMTVFDELEKLRLGVNASNADLREIGDVFEKIRAWQREYQPSLEALKKEHDGLRSALETNKGDEANDEKRKHP